MDSTSKSEYQDRYIGWPINYTKIEDEDCTCWRFNIHKSHEKCPCTNKKFFNNDPVLKLTLKSIADNYRALIDQQRERAMKFNVNVIPLINRCEEKCKRRVRRKEHPVCQDLENRMEKLDCFTSRVGQQNDQQNEVSCCCCCSGGSCGCSSCCCNGSPECCDCCCCQEPDPCEKCNACPNVYVDNSQREEFLRLQLQEECEPKKYCERSRRRTCACHRARQPATVEEMQRRPFKGCSDVPLDHSFNHYLTTPDIAKLRYMQNEYMTYDDWYTIP